MLYVATMLNLISKRISVYFPAKLKFSFGNGTKGKYEIANYFWFKENVIECFSVITDIIFSHKSNLIQNNIKTRISGVYLQYNEYLTLT